jgi:hypothetical protein
MVDNFAVQTSYQCGNVSKINGGGGGLGTNRAGISSVVDPDPDPPDPHVFGPPGSGSTSQRYGSGSFYHHAKLVRKTLIPSI